MTPSSNAELEKVEKHLNQIMDLHQQANKDAFAEIVRRLSPLDTWPTRMDGLANEIKELQKSYAVVDGKANQKDVDLALENAKAENLKALESANKENIKAVANAKAATFRANISLLVTLVIFALALWDRFNP